MNRSKTTVLTLALGALLMTGCVSKKNLESCQAELKNCQTENRELTGNYQNTKEQLAAAQARVASLSDQLAEQQKAYKALQQSLDKSLANTSANSVNISKLVDQINESNQYIRHLVEVKGVVYISLADNMLYKSGSYEISERAEETLSKIAKIIMDYKDYDVLIEGNTDNVPVNTKAASMKNIRNNWDLSALRASSVVQYLQNRFGVAPKRLTAGGRGEYNPVASNDTEVGKQRNRRTQIIITPKLDQFMDLIDKAPESEK